LIDFGSEDLQELNNRKGKLAEAFEEGQAPRRAVEPMIMMIIFGPSTDLLHAVKSYDIGRPALLPIRRVCCGFLSPLQIHRLGWV
jgi:hypothetical protein